MNTETLGFQTETRKPKNNSKLSFSDCCIILHDWNRSFEQMSNDDLDSLYFVVTKSWAQHLTRQAYIDYLNKYRIESVSI